MANKWERHNAPNGEHIWCGDEHIADITANTYPGIDTNVSEIARSAVLMHNDPKYGAVEAMYGALEAIEYMLSVDKVELKNHPVTAKMVREALAEARRKG